MKNPFHQKVAIRQAALRLTVLTLLTLFSSVLQGVGEIRASGLDPRAVSNDAPPPVPIVASSPAGMATNAVDRSQMIYIREFRVIGSHQLDRAEIEKAVYPFMGPERTPEDVEQARAALEKAFQDKGFQTVNVQIPQQTGKRGIVFLEVTEAKIGRLTVEGSRFFSLKAIKKGVPSLQPGTVPNFNQVSSEILALNQWSDRQVIPTLTPGFEPGTVDVTLKVKDNLPWHGSAEFNNRYNPNTVPYRFNLATSYDNLWQLGHSLGGSFQAAPQDTSNALNWNAFYTARFPRIDWLRLNLSYGEQNSNVSTLGGTAVNGAGQTAAFRFLAALPNEKDFSHSISAGMDFKHLDQAVNQTTSDAAVAELPPTPLDYAPIRMNYNAVWAPKDSVTIFDAGISFGIRGAIIPVYNLGTYGNEQQFADLRYNSDGGFFVLKSDLSHTHDLPAGFQIYGKVQGQVSPEPLVYSEQFAGGGLDSCRGYLEGTVAGDNALFGSVELRSPSLLGGHAGINEWRVYGFLDGGAVTLNDPLPGQTSLFNMAAYGFGSRLRMFNHLNGSIDVGIPTISQQPVMAYAPLITFRIFGEF
ncbi:MAG: ShlB/FhaC/HecB family hemolysin secretion/activation protein [Verrucomicrobia bacterium]|nr:ShlB/FhaC/HecB family hemolysin secretion/activation protein [Verrucomicrobiota bacterium]